MSDFVGLRETFLKAYTESHNDTSDDDVLKELPSIFQDTRAIETNLTKLLRPALSRGSKTVLIVNVSPTIASAKETKESLRFAQDAKKVKLGKALCAITSM